MKRLLQRTFLAALLLGTGHALYAQKSKISGDTTVQLKVGGACGMCKERIEETVKGKGVQSALWDENTRQLTLVFNPSLVSLRKIQGRLAGAGHDTENEKASDAVYNALPPCCHYRELDISEDPGAGAAIPRQIKGVVLEENKKGSFVPLPGASVAWLGTNKGTLADSTGVFILPVEQGLTRLVISFAGYTSDTLTLSGSNTFMIILASGKQLNEVTVSARLRSSYINSLQPIRTQVMTEKELYKAACCNLSESFETNPSVDVSYSDAVTGSKQIQLLGLSGNYTQLTVESLPGPRGLATPLGLSFIAGPWVESIQLSKGVGSVANGFESIAGQINVELKKPEKAEKLYANFYVNEMGKTDVNLVVAQKLGKKWSTAFLLHDAFLANKKVDFNKDGFRDLTTGNLFSAVNRWKYDDGKGLLLQFGLKILTDNRTGGETGFDPGKHQFSSIKYGLGIDTRRYEGFAKLGYVFPEKKYKSIGLQVSAYSHKQDSYFGMNRYDARQKNFYANLIYQSILGSTLHKFRTGLSLTADDYQEEWNTTTYLRKETVPGAFFEYTWSPVAAFTLVAGMRADYNNLYGWFATPRLHLRYEPVTGTTIRLSSGRGQRTANILAENTGVFVSARQVTILPAVTGKAYGLEPETAWNHGVSLDQKFRIFTRDAGFSLDFFRNDFTNQVVVDLEDPRQVRFYNLDGRSFSNSFQAEVHMEPVRKGEIRLAYRFFDVRTTYAGLLLQKPLTARHRAFANLAYEINGWKLDYTINYNGTKRIPSTAANPVSYQRRTASPAYYLMNAQLSKTAGKKHPVDLYVGGENLTGFIQQDVLISAENPFNSYFDASLVWGPVTGRMLYAGLRYKIK